MGVGEWFETCNANLQVSEANVISQRYCAITRRLNIDFWNTDSETAHSLYVGSYGRNTAIHGISDVDMLFQLPSSMYTQYNGHLYNGQSALLQAVRESIKRTYAITSVGADGQVICVPFTDKISFEVLPAFVRDDNSYLFPDSNNGGSWRVTNPRPEIAAIRDRNTNCNFNLVPLCRLMRAWKGLWTVPISGLLIDTLAYQFIGNWQYRDKSFFYHDFMCRDFFLFLANQDGNQTVWKAPGSGQHVSKSGNFQYKAKQCYNLAVDAIQYNSDNKEWSATQKWKEIFGTAFPNN